MKRWRMRMKRRRWWRRKWRIKRRWRWRMRRRTIDVRVRQINPELKVGEEEDKVEEENTLCFNLNLSFKFVRSIRRLEWGRRR